MMTREREKYEERIREKRNKMTKKNKKMETQGEESVVKSEEKKMK